jgi:hypothetical protein
MKKLLSGLLLILLCCSPVFAEKTIVSEFAGPEWQGWTAEKKFNFLTGFLLGSSYIIKNNEPFIPKEAHVKQFDDMRKRLSLRPDKKKKAVQNTFTRDEVILWGHYRASMIQNGLAGFGVYEITVSQLAQRLDELYQDSRNAKITIADAIHTVKLQFEGASREDVEKRLQYLRGD